MTSARRRGPGLVRRAAHCGPMRAAMGFVGFVQIFAHSPPCSTKSSNQCHQISLLLVACCCCRRRLAGLSGRSGVSRLSVSSALLCPACLACPVACRCAQRPPAPCPLPAPCPRAQLQRIRSRWARQGKARQPEETQRTSRHGTRLARAAADPRLLTRPRLLSPSPLLLPGHALRAILIRSDLLDVCVCERPAGESHTTRGEEGCGNAWPARSWVVRGSRVALPPPLVNPLPGTSSPLVSLLCPWTW